MNKSGQNGTQRPELTPKQHRFLAALITERTVEDAAKTANVGRTTAYRWLAEPEFRERLQAAELSVIESSARSLIGLADKAIETMRAVLDDSNASGALRVRTADAVLGRILQLRNLVSIESRLQELEERLLDKEERKR